MTFVVGVNSSTGSNWNTNSGSGNLAITYTPTTSNPHIDVTPLPASQKLVELGVFLDIGSGRNTTIPMGIYEFTGSGDASLLQGFEVPVTDAGGTGYQWATLTVDVDASGWSGKRLGVGRTQPRDTGNIGIRYNGSLNNGALYQGNIGFTPDLPASVSASKANSEACYAIFEDAPSGATAVLISGNSSFGAIGEVARISQSALISQSSNFNSNAFRLVESSAVLESQSASVNAIAERLASSNANLISQNSTFSGELNRILQGDGILISQNANFSGSATSSNDVNVAIANLISSNSEFSASAKRIVIFVGELQSDQSNFQAASHRIINGFAEFLSGNSNFDGQGSVEITNHILSGNLISGSSGIFGILTLEQINNIPAFPSSWLKMDYQELFDDVAELLYELGDNRLFYKKNESTFNPRTGNVQAQVPVNSRVQGQGAMYNFKSEEYDGENVRFGDMMMIFQPYKNSNYAPEIGMFCETAGATWRLLNFEKIIPANKLIAYVMHLRK